jgi:predicted kinase
MRRRSRRAPNTSESTGKIGQEVPTNQLAPLVPLYPDEILAQASAEPTRRVQESRQPDARPGGQKPQAPKPQEPRNNPQRAPEQRNPDQRNPDQRNPDQRSGAPRQPEHRPSQTAHSAPGAAAPASRPARQSRPARSEWVEPTGSGKLELETQPELPTAEQAESEAAGKSPQAPKGYVVLAIGMPGSGKTTWFRRRGVTPLSSDLLRNILFDDVEEQRYQGLVFSTLRSLLRARLIARMPWNYVDATNLSIHERRQWIKMAQSFGYEVQGVFFDVPLAVCLERNSQRDRSVSEDVMRKMAEKLKPPAFEEGFAKITVVRVKTGS